MSVSSTQLYSLINGTTPIADATVSRFTSPLNR